MPSYTAVPGLWIQIQRPTEDRVVFLPPPPLLAYRYHHRSPRRRRRAAAQRLRSGEMAAKAISSPVPVDWYPTLAVVMVAVGLMFTASFFIYEATSSRRNRSLAKEIATATIASVFLGFGSLFVLLASGVYTKYLGKCFPEPDPTNRPLGL
uniref:Dolichyl-diphosphooligosaccharide-protein glycosyltransferase subunit OST5 n=1 Tax=Oryza meridionalis TaxID=40149 RepID=A0A0E0E2Z1_9ORYZ